LETQKEEDDIKIKIKKKKKKKKKNTVLYYESKSNQTIINKEEINNVIQFKEYKGEFSEKITKDCIFYN
jgi:hypothetical protein